MHNLSLTDSRDHHCRKTCEAVVNVLWTRANPFLIARLYAIIALEEKSMHTTRR